MAPHELETRFLANFEECCRRVQRGESLEQCLDNCPAEHRDEIVRLAPLVSKLSQVGRDPSPEFQARLEQRLLASLEEARHAQRTGPLGWFRRLRTAAPAIRFAALGLVAMIVLAGGGLGVVQASENSLPDSPLYQIKEAREWAELAMTRDNKNLVRVYSRHIQRRDHELERAVQGKKARQVSEALVNRISSSVERTVDKALEASAKGNLRPTDRARVLLDTTRRHLDSLAEQASPQVQPSLQRLRSFLDEQEGRLPKGD